MPWGCASIFDEVGVLLGFGRMGYLEPSSHHWYQQRGGVACFLFPALRCEMWAQLCMDMQSEDELSVYHVVGHFMNQMSNRMEQAHWKVSDHCNIRLFQAR